MFQIKNPDVAVDVYALINNISKKKKVTNVTRHINDYKAIVIETDAKTFNELCKTYSASGYYVEDKGTGVMTNFYQYS